MESLKNKKLIFYNTKGLTESENISNNKLCPHWVSGFCDAESCFSIRITKDKNRKTAWRVSPIFIIELNNKDILLLKRVRDFFGVGSFTERKNGNVLYCVQSFANLTDVIIPHFNKYPLLTKKRADFFVIYIYNRTFKF